MKVSDQAICFVSVDSRKFSNERVRDIIQIIGARHDKIIFFVANGLDQYNQVQGEKRDATANFSHDLAARIRSISHEELNISSSVQIEVGSWSRSRKKGFLSVLRSLFIYYGDSCSFRDSVDKRASLISRSKSAFCSLDIDSSLNRAVCYILEETAMSLFIAGKYGISDEYYPSDRADVLRMVYDQIDARDNNFNFCVRVHKKRFWTIEDNQVELAWSNKNGVLFG